MKKKFVPRSKAHNVKVSLSVFPTHITYASVLAYDLVPGDTFWFNDLGAKVLEQARFIPGKRCEVDGSKPMYRLTGKNADGSAFDTLIHFSQLVTVKIKATHVVRFIGGEQLFGAAPYSQMARSGALKLRMTDDLFFVADNYGNVRLLNLGSEIEIVKAL
ncbi:hypothetical protein [Erwinia phage Snitter]|nr:hypothetical protein [Erwinia phage Snitter]